MIKIRIYYPGDEYEIVKLFRETIHTINAKDYSQEQLDVWAPNNPNIEQWRKRLEGLNTFVAVEESSGKIVGFAGVTNEGYLDLGYVHKAYQRQGIGTMLLRAREEKARELGLKHLYSNVSITAKPLFERHGYKIEKEQKVTLKGVEFINYRMSKEL